MNMEITLLRYFRTNALKTILNTASVLYYPAIHLLRQSNAAVCQEDSTQVSTFLGQLQRSFKVMNLSEKTMSQSHGNVPVVTIQRLQVWPSCSFNESPHQSSYCIKAITRSKQSRTLKYQSVQERQCPAALYPSCTRYSEMTRAKYAKHLKSQINFNKNVLQHIYLYIYLSQFKLNYALKVCSLFVKKKYILVSVCQKSWKGSELL